jgi:hypothetical protein
VKALPLFILFYLEEVNEMLNSKEGLNNACPALDKADLGDKLDQLIVLVNELKSDYNAHIANDTLHTGVDSVNIVENPDVDNL